ncbi:hypothetical protein AMS68_004060 [Peltaster fructicola]|uniref:Uncharacterized protein n=1 Tax=Peltaster fructicola TaxID=286661 RepID=A0A6H0XUY0_9PEZI|nr:hypothetical protein AMS68_004060 [Peltaster fructicola]
MAPYIEWLVLACAAIIAHATALLPQTNAGSPTESQSAQDVIALESSHNKRQAFFLQHGNGVCCQEEGDALARSEITEAFKRLSADCDAGGDGFLPGWSPGHSGRRSASYGNVTVFACNFDGHAQNCLAEEIFPARNGVFHQCGIDGLHSSPGQS